MPLPTPLRGPRASHRGHSHNMYGDALAECRMNRRWVAEHTAAMIMDAEPDTMIDTVCIGQDLWLCRARIFDQERVASVHVGGPAQPYLVTADWFAETGEPMRHTSEASVSTGS